MFMGWETVFANRDFSIKGQKLVSQVVKHHEKQNGLVQIRTRDLHDGWPDEALPWVQMKGGFGSGNSGGTTDQTKQLPPVGSKVYTEYENNSQYHGVYHGGSATDDKVVNDFKNEEKTSYGHADPGGNLHKVNTKEGEESIERTHVKGSGDKFDKDGNYILASAKDVKMEGQGDGHHKFKGKMIFEADSFEFRSKGKIMANVPITMGGSSPTSPTAPKARSRPTFKAPGTSV